MRAFVLGTALVYAAFAVLTLCTDEAVRVANPWVVSFLLSAMAVPALAAWGGAELARLVFSRDTLRPGASGWARRMARGVVAGVLGLGAALGAVVSNVLPVDGSFTRGGSAIEDSWLMALTAATSAGLLALIGRRARPGACAGCGYDLGGLTAAAEGRCPECGLPTLASAPEGTGPAVR